MVKIDDVIDGRWVVTEKLPNKSGQGITFKVNDRLRKIGGVSVLKLLKKVDEKSLARFRKEIKASLDLDHPNIVHVEAARYENIAQPFLVTRFYEGGELSKGKVSNLSLYARIGMFRKVCDAVAFAHENKVVHRDIKP
jgi:serine/threonine protein kinase